MIKYIEIGGAKRPVRYNHNALEEFEEITGLSMMDETIIAALKKVKNQKALAFCGLKHGFLEANDYSADFPESLVTVGRWLNVTNVYSIFDAYRKDTEGYVEPEEEADADAKKSLGVTSVV